MEQAKKQTENSSKEKVISLIEEMKDQANMSWHKENLTDMFRAFLDLKPQRTNTGDVFTTYTDLIELLSAAEQESSFSSRPI